MITISSSECNHYAFEVRAPQVRPHIYLTKQKAKAVQEQFKTVQELCTIDRSNILPHGGNDSQKFKTSAPMPLGP
jgi:hypothetical protein